MCRIAGYVEEIHSESARRLKLPLGEDIHKQTFLAETIVFREVKVCDLNFNMLYTVCIVSYNRHRKNTLKRMVLLTLLIGTTVQ